MFGKKKSRKVFCPFKYISKGLGDFSVRSCELLFNPVTKKLVTVTRFLQKGRLYVMIADAESPACNPFIEGAQYLLHSQEWKKRIAGFKKVGKFGTYLPSNEWESLSYVPHKYWYG